MSYTIRITGLKEQGDRLRQLQQLLAAGRAPAQAAARGVANLVRRHFEGLPANKMGWPTTNFWKKAARSVSVQGEGAEPVVLISHLGVRQRLQGGVIKPVRAKLLAIPATADAYGKRPREVRAPLAFVRFADGKMALVEREHTPVSFGRKRKDGTRGVKRGENRGGQVWFWLARSVKQKPDPNVLPTQEALLNEAFRGASAWLQLRVKPV